MNQIFREKIIHIYGARGELWLNQLPFLIDVISENLKLYDLKSFENLSYNYVLTGRNSENIPVILKLGLNPQDLEHEANALRAFSGYGAVEMLFQSDGVLLLSCATPGTTLKNDYPQNEIESIEIVCRLINRLHCAPIPTHHHFFHIRDWLKILDQEWALPSQYLFTARTIRDDLLQYSGKDIVLHGDLHHENILKHHDQWICIDPKGVIGERAYDVCAFIRNPIPDLLDHPEYESIIQRRIQRCSQILEIDSSRIIRWCFVQSVLGWVWSIEDHCDESFFRRITEYFSSIL